MSLRAVYWILVASVAAAGILLLNYWGSYQPLSTLAYTGIVLALCGLANVVMPFRFLGIRRRAIGLLVLAAGVIMAVGALLWPAPTVRVAQHTTVLDDAMPEYQFYERHSTRVHAPPEQVMQAVRQSTFGDLKSLDTLLKIRAAVLRVPFQGGDALKRKRVLDAFSEAGYLNGGNEHEVALFGVWNARANRRPDVKTMQDFVAYREAGGLKIAYSFSVEDAGDGWCKLSTETRVMTLDDATRRGMGRYWRLIVPGSGLLRRQWLDGIKQRAESVPERASS